MDLKGSYKRKQAPLCDLRDYAVMLFDDRTLAHLVQLGGKKGAPKRQHGHAHPLQDTVLGSGAMCFRWRAVAQALAIGYPAIKAGCCNIGVLQLQGITLLSLPMKVFSRILERTICPLVES